jgi:hypothetical protein
MGVLPHLSASLLNAQDFVTMHNEGVYIPFPSFLLKLSNLKLKSYLPALTILNAMYLLQMRAYGSRSDYNMQVRLILMAHLRWRINSKVFSKFVLAHFS